MSLVASSGDEVPIPATCTVSQLSPASAVPGGAIVWAAGSTGVGTVTNPLVLQNG
jgi:hypothetical protein